MGPVCIFDTSISFTSTSNGNTPDYAKSSHKAIIANSSEIEFADNYNLLKFSPSLNFIVM